jgi:carboxypeptidase A2
MQLLKVLALILFVAVNYCFTEKFSFKGYHFVRLTPKNENHLNLLGKWENNPEFDIWNSIKGVESTVDVVLSPKAFKKYEKLFTLANLPYTLIDSNIQDKIEEQEKSMIREKSEKNIAGKYARYSEIVNFINDIVANNNDIASTYSAGKTYENRDLKVLVLKTSTSQKAVWLDCGIHAREWVSPSSCVWFMDRLIKDYRANDNVAVDLLNYYEFHILPLVNPDGYEYSHTTYRLWRKNRAPNAGSSCIGTDLNRNYDFQWMVTGASNNPCADTYAGKTPGSEIETKAVKNAINAKLGKWDVFLSLHAYGQYWMTPWGYTSTLPTDYDQLKSISQIGVNALKAVSGTTYTIGPPYYTVAYAAAGGSFDWTKAVAGIKYSISLELRPGSSGVDSQYGFTLPEDRAPATGEETYKGLKAMINAIKNL